MTCRDTCLGRCQRRARSWTPMSRADRNRLRRGESPRVELWMTTWLSDRYTKWERRMMRGTDRGAAVRAKIGWFE